jgi:hypothetical protein
MTPDPLTQLLTDLRALVATMLPAIDLLQTDLAGAASHDTYWLHRAGVAPARQAGNEGQHVAARGAALASREKGRAGTRPGRHSVNQG